MVISQKRLNILILCELAFSLPFSNGKVEQIFSSLKTLKTSRRTNMQSDTLNDLLEIYVEGPPLSFFVLTKLSNYGGMTAPRQEDQISNLERTINHKTKSHLTPVMPSLLTLRIHHLLCRMIGFLILKLNNLIKLYFRSSLLFT